MNFGTKSRLNAFAADLNADGMKDVVVSYLDAGGTRLARIFLNDGSGTLSASAGIDFASAANAAIPRAFASTASGELAVLSDAGVRFYRVQANALTESRPALTVLAKDAVALALGDVNGDGIEDLVVGMASGFDLYLGNAVVQ
jgi:hypothetical protein